MDLDVVHIGRRLKNRRLRAGLTQEELARKAGTTQTTVARIERDAVEPEVTTIRKLAGALGITPADLIPEEDWVPLAYHKPYQNSVSASGVSWRFTTSHRVESRLRRTLQPPTAVYGKQRDETVGYVLKGRAELHLEGVVIPLATGDSWTVPRGALHTYRILEPFTAVEATSPPAETGDRDKP